MPMVLKTIKIMKPQSIGIKLNKNSMENSIKAHCTQGGTRLFIQRPSYCLVYGSMMWGKTIRKGLKDEGQSN